LKATVTSSFETGAVQVRRTPSAPPLTCSAAGSANVPLTRWPGAVVLGSATLSVASPAEETTVAVVAAV